MNLRLQNFCGKREKKKKSYFFNLYFWKQRLIPLFFFMKDRMKVLE